jgi:hypothetical protein
VPDYYGMLGVDSKADRATIEAALARCQPQWSSGTRNPKNKHTYQSYLDQIPALRQTLLGDPVTRAAYDAELVAALRAERDSKLDQLERLVRLRSAKGGLTTTDCEALRTRAVDLGLNPGDADIMIAVIPPQPESPAEENEDEAEPDVLDQTTRRQIQVALDHLRRRDLYDALGLGRDASIEEVTDRADLYRQHWMRKTQVTAEKTAWLEVIALAQSHLTVAAARARYDRTLGLEAEERLVEFIEWTLAGQSRLDPGPQAALIDEATAMGIVPDRAERLIQRVCRRLGVARDLSALPATRGPALRLIRCRGCSALIDFEKLGTSASPATATCKRCGTSLRWDCPNCRQGHWVDQPRCRCGFRLEQYGTVVRHFEAAQDAYQARDYMLALQQLQRVQELAPRHAGAAKAIDKIQDRLVKLARLRADWTAALAAGRLIAARKALEDWRRLAGTEDPDWRSAWVEVDRGVSEALALVSRARPLERTQPAAARSLYRQSLQRATDLPEALAGLERCPPDPPRNLQVEYTGAHVRLHWTKPESEDGVPLAFAVVRKTGGVPEHPRDGTRIGETSVPEFEDDKVIAGASYGYAVLSQRAGVDSLKAATTGPIVLLGEVTDVRVSSASRQVELSWTPPPAAWDVLVVRKQGSSPRGPDDGQVVEAHRGHAFDRNLEDDRVYHYALFAVYQTAGGRRETSRGVRVTAQPHAPIAPLEALAPLALPSGAVRLTWPPPQRGSVRVLRTPRPTGHTAGDSLTTAQAEALKGHWLEPGSPGQADDPAPPPIGSCCYTPWTVWAGTWTVGESLSYSCLPDPTELRATRIGNGSRVHLRWRWSPQGSQSLVVARTGTPPRTPDDPQAIQLVVHENEYSRQGYVSLTLPQSDRQPWHIAVFAVTAVDGHRVVSPGIEPTARTVVPGPHPEVTVRYALRRSRVPGRPWSLTFQTEPAGSPIPPTALVAHPRTVPLSVDDGEIVARFPTAQDGATFPIRSALDLAKHRARLFTDPRAAPDSLTPIRLRHPEPGGTRA